jgi:predicted RNase H-like HicB family nuclease
MSLETAAHPNRVKVIIERTEDGYIAYPLGMKGIVIGQGDSYHEALADVTSAIHSHLEEFGRECLEEATSALEAFIAEAEVPV